MTTPMPWTDDARAAACLKMILEQPDDDGPRLILCDRLEEIGESDRAEFIRVQCELSRMETWASEQFMVLPESREGLYIEALRQREQELFTYPNMFKWFMDGKPVAAVAHDDPPTVEQCRGMATAFVRRGFIEHLTCDWQSWLTHHAALRAASPVRCVRLTTLPVFETVVHAEQMPMRDGFTYTRPTGTRWRLQGGTKWTECDSETTRDPRGLTLAALRAEWPGLTFELPPPVRGTYFTASTAMATMPPTEIPVDFMVGIEDAEVEFVGSYEPQPTEAPAAPRPRRRNSRRPDWLDQGQTPRRDRP